MKFESSPQFSPHNKKKVVKLRHVLGFISNFERELLSRCDGLPALQVDTGQNKRIIFYPATEDPETAGKFAILDLHSRQRTSLLLGFW